MKNLAKMVDEYGVIVEKIKELEEKQKSLREELEKLEEGAYQGKEYILTVSKSERITYDPSVLNKIPKKDIPKVVTIKSNIKDFLPKTELMKFIENTKIVTTLKTKKIGDKK